jgi:hypothetical protein
MKACQVCGKTSQQGHTISTCTRCQAASYCGQTCQRSDWKSHRGLCKEKPTTVPEKLNTWQILHWGTLFYAAAHGLDVNSHPEHLATKALYIDLAERQGTHKASAAFRVVSVQVVDREEFIRDKREQFGQTWKNAVNAYDSRVKEQGDVGNAIVFITVGGTWLRSLPFRLSELVCSIERVDKWEGDFRRMVDLGLPLNKLHKEYKRQKSRAP